MSEIVQGRSLAKGFSCSGSPASERAPQPVQGRRCAIHVRHFRVAILERNALHRKGSNTSPKTRCMSGLSLDLSSLICSTE